MLTEGSYWGFSGNIQVIKELLVLLLSLSQQRGLWPVYPNFHAVSQLCSSSVLVQLHVSCASLHWNLVSYETDSGGMKDNRTHGSSSLPRFLGVWGSPAGSPAVFGCVWRCELGACRDSLAWNRRFPPSPPSVFFTSVILAWNKAATLDTFPVNCGNSWPKDGTALPLLKAFQPPGAPVN